MQVNGGRLLKCGRGNVCPFISKELDWSLLEVPFIPCYQLFKRLLISFGRIFTWSDCVQSKPKFIYAHPTSIININISISRSYIIRVDILLKGFSSINQKMIPILVSCETLSCGRRNRPTGWNGRISWPTISINSPHLRLIAFPAIRYTTNRPSRQTSLSLLPNKINNDTHG